MNQWQRAGDKLHFSRYYFFEVLALGHFIMYTVGSVCPSTSILVFISTTFYCMVLYPVSSTAAVL